jgi:sulfur-oxidizing protein SoxA
MDRRQRLCPPRDAGDRSGLRLPGLALLLAAAAAPAQTGSDTRRSGLEFMSPALQAMQRDDSRNPAMLAVQDGAALWQSRAGGAAKSCRDCHGDAVQAMRGVAARYPAWDEAGDAPLNLAGRINACRQRHQRAEPLPPDDGDALALSAYVALQSRGLPLAPPGDARLAPLRAQGQTLWRQRLGQLNLSCAQCHDQRAGLRLGGAVIPEAHATGYPTYRLEWSGLGSLQRRLRGCVTGVRAQGFAPEAIEWLALEAWMAERDRGMALEAPALRP